MNKAKVIRIEGEELVFDNGARLWSNHDTDCCEHHYLSFGDLTLDDFEDLEFDLTDGINFKRIVDYGIELIPIHGHSVKIPGYGSNNGYYSSDLTLILSMGEKKYTYDVTECQHISW